jgi:hypothetical protein
MNRATARIALALAALGTAACGGGRGLYYWNGYDVALYQHYRSPQDRESFVAALVTTVRQADDRGLRVPPGVSAELGYALYEEGRTQEAVPWFERERREWPESQVLMDKMIRNAKQRAAQQPPAAASTTGAAGAATRGGGK